MVGSSFFFLFECKGDILGIVPEFWYQNVPLLMSYFLHLTNTAKTSMSWKDKQPRRQLCQK